MKACVLKNIGKLEYTEVDRPKVQKGEALIKIKACGICSSDIDRVFKTGTYHFPTIPGHEFAGEIIEIGEGVSSEYIGKKVAIFPLVPCMECDSCKSGFYQRCDNYNYFGSRSDGGFAEYISVPVWNLVMLDETMDYKLGAMCEPSAVAFHSIQRAKLSPNDNVLIIGTGAIGILTAIWAFETGVKKVTVLGRNARKLEFIKNLGNFDTINISEVQSRVLDFDVVFECVGKQENIESALYMTKKGGTIVLTGNPAKDILLQRNVYWKILRNELTIVGTWNSSFNSKSNDWTSVLNYMIKNSEKLLKLITHQYLLSDSEEAFNTLRNQNVFAIKVMFTM